MLSINELACREWWHGGPGRPHGRTGRRHSDRTVGAVRGRPSRRTGRTLLVVTLVATLLAGCRTGRNYTAADGPWYEGSPRHAQAEVTGQFASADTLDVVAFNIKHSARPDLALALMLAEPELARADVVLLNEMDEHGTRLIADSLGMSYVYYPAVLHRTGRHFGNAILSRWPIVEHERITLPHIARFQRTHRTTTAATIRVGSTHVRVHATHLGTVMEIGPGARREQLRTVLSDAARYDHAIVGGDMNHPGVGRVADEFGFTWPTRDGPRTTFFGRVDHIFLRGLATPDSAGSGTITDARGASDHRPVWTRAIVPARPGAPSVPRPTPPPPRPQLLRLR